MIEAINASISNAQLVRSVATEASTSQSANPVRIQKAAIVAPYLSPHVRLAPNSKPVFVVRDLETGTQIKQFPTEAQIRAYQKASQSKPEIQPLTGEAKEMTSDEARIMIKTSVEFKEERAAVKYQADLPMPGQKKESSGSTFQPGQTTSVDEQA